MSKKSVNAPPGARRLIESLQDLGYETATATEARHQSGIFLGAFALLPSNAPAPNIMVTKGAKPSLIRIVVPQDHPCFRAFSASGRNADFEQLFYTLLGTLEGLILDQIDPEDVPLDSLKRQLKKVL